MCASACVVPCPSRRTPTVDTVQTRRRAALQVERSRRSCWPGNRSHPGTPPPASGILQHTCSSTEETGTEPKHQHTHTRNHKHMSVFVTFQDATYVTCMQGGRAFHIPRLILNLTLSLTPVLSLSDPHTVFTHGETKSCFYSASSPQSHTHSV